MAHFKCFQLRNSILIWIAFLVPFSVLAIISDNGVLSMHITFLLLILSTIFIFIFSKQEPETLISDEQVEDKDLSFSSAVKQHLSENGQVISEQQPATDQTITESGNLTALQSTPQVQQVVAEEKHENGEDQFHVYSVRSSQDLYSESESNDHSFSSEDSDVDWPCSGKMGQSPDCSDDSISDEESLIEIAIPSGHYLCNEKEKEDPKFSFQYKPQDFSPETMFKQHSFMDLLAEISEMNEEDNLIEIDISVGSIKCSRFEIEA